MRQEIVIRPVEIGECLICRVVVSGLKNSFMNVQGGINLTRIGQEYQFYTQRVRGAIPDMIISETVKASYNRVFPAVQFKAVMPAGNTKIAGDNFMAMAHYMVQTFCIAGMGEAIVTIGNREVKLYASGKA